MLSNRLTDDQSQSRIREEAAAMEGIFRTVCETDARWVSSMVLELEISRNPDPERRRDATALLEFADEVVTPGPETTDRALELQRLGFGSFDALHLACAELGEANVFLTTDDDLLRHAKRHREKLRVPVDNPLSWYRRRQA